VSYFVVVASILGTGILALPVKVGETGFYPFLIQFAICAVFQCLVLLFMIELLQKAATHQVRFRYLTHYNLEIEFHRSDPTASCP
jgi:amino acid permease